MENRDRQIQKKQPKNRKTKHKINKFRFRNQYTFEKNE